MARMHHIEMHKTAWGYKIRRNTGFSARYEYLKSFRDGKAVWTTDYLYGGEWSEKTARKYIEAICKAN